MAGPGRRLWREIRLGSDEGEEEWERPRRGVSPTNMEVRAVENALAIAPGSKAPVDVSHGGDAPVLPDVPGRILRGEVIGSVTADGACGTCRCHDAIADRSVRAVGHSLTGGGPVLIPAAPQR